MNEVVTLETIATEAHKADQMGRQTVEQLAKVGQMILEYRAVNPTMEHLSRVINATGYQQAHIYRLERLAKNLPLLEQHKPDSLRAALALIAASKAPPRAIPAPTPQKSPEATPATPEAPPATPEDRARAVKAEVEEIPDQFNLSAPLKVRYEKAVERAWKKLSTEAQTQIEERVQKEVNERLPARIAHGEAQIAKWKASHVQRERVLDAREESVDHLITEEEFKIIRGCLHSDRVPDELKEKFDRAFAAVNKLAPWFSHNAAEKKAAEKSERFRRQWNAAKRSMG